MQTAKILRTSCKLEQVIRADLRQLGDTYEVTLPAHEGRPAHQARLWVRAGVVSLKKSASKSRQPLPKVHPTGVVWVRQDPATVPTGQPPIDWVLLTRAASARTRSARPGKPGS